MPQAEPLPVRPRRAKGFDHAKPQRDPQVAPAPVHYPVEDDQPMSETFKHAQVTVDAKMVLNLHCADRADVCVGGNNFLYYEEGNPRAVVSPNVFLAYGVPKETDREVWKVWVEGKTPDFVLEVTSKSTKWEDEGRKKDVYERLGVREYWQFDPTGDYLDPILKGRALADGRYHELELEQRDGGLCRFSAALGLDLRLEDERLRFFDPQRGEYLLTPEEQHQALRERDRALAAAEARIRELERQRRHLEG
ncbi:MAG: Uma2 family endonuclease [Gammaproteobacteria bacterium]|nr:Uma2 family endonuclease [Gammaproteobacteria bacterium]